MGTDRTADGRFARRNRIGVASRWKRGTSGNPRGRPPKALKQSRAFPIITALRKLIDTDESIVHLGWYKGKVWDNHTRQWVPLMKWLRGTWAKWETVWCCAGLHGVKEPGGEVQPHGEWLVNKRAELELPRWAMDRLFCFVWPAHLLGMSVPENME